MKKEKNMKTLIIIWGIIGLSSGFVIIHQHVFNEFIKSLARWVLTVEEFQKCTPGMFEMFNLFMGICIILVSIFGIIYVNFINKVDHFLNRNYNRILSVILITLLILGLCIAINKSIFEDEVEHIHSAWYITKGAVPYLDFFQHHNPLFWYVISPCLLIFGDSVELIFIFRILMYLFTLGIAYMTYTIANSTTKSKETGLFSVILLFSVIMFMETSIEIRPDVPQVLLSMISIAFLIKFFQKHRTMDLLICALMASISFLFLQKTVFLLLAYVIIFLKELISKKISLRLLFCFMAAFVLPLFLFIIYLTLTKALNDYVITNYLFNLSIHLGRQIQTLTLFSVHNGIFGLSFIISIPVLLMDHKMNHQQRTIILIGLVLLLIPVLMGKINPRYLLSAIPILCITVGYFFRFCCKRYQFSEINRILIIILFLIMPSFFLIKRSFINRNRSQISEMEFVLKNSDENDFVYDGKPEFNLYRQDLHYYWFDIGKELTTLTHYYKGTENRCIDYEIYNLIDSKKPKFISDFGIDMTINGLPTLYEETQYKGLFMRKDEKAVF
ncbi:glycosyltransferase family 39 protein [bacterium]|nr:glycosyltransferase family 39 protein [bacterium]